jgi:hypothetical protein
VLVIIKCVIVFVATRGALRVALRYKKGYMFTISNNVNGDAHCGKKKL